LSFLYRYFRSKEKVQLISEGFLNDAHTQSIGHILILIVVAYQAMADAHQYCVNDLLCF